MILNHILIFTHRHIIMSSLLGIIFSKYKLYYLLFYNFPNKRKTHVLSLLLELAFIKHKPVILKTLTLKTHSTVSKTSVIKSNLVSNNIEKNSAQISQIIF